MKKLVSACISAVLAVSTLSMGLFASAANLSDIGEIGQDKTLPSNFIGKENQLRQKYKETYQWALQLHAQKANDGLFDFGNASGELLHLWSGTDANDQPHDICNQDFDGGNSTASGTFSYNNWAALVCANPDTLDVIVMRDAAAEYYGKGGGVNNLQTSDPITNQYWRMEDGIPVVYQQFVNGYLRSEEGESWYTEFFSKIDLGADYVEPPQAPPAYGDIYAVNADGCSWENPKYFPKNDPGDDHTNSGGGNQGTGNQGTGNQGGGNQGGVITDPTDPNFDPNAVGGDQNPDGQNPDGQTPDGQTPDGQNPEGTGSDTAALNSGTASGNKTNANANKTDSKGGANTVRKMNVGATVGIIGGVVVVLGGGAFCLYWFVLRKKKVAEGADAAVADAPKTEDKPEEKSDK